MSRPDRPPVITPAASPPARSRIGCVLAGVLLGGGLLVCGLVIVGGVFVAREMMAESSGQGFRVHSSAVRAYQEAQKTKPGSHLLLTGYYPTGGMVYLNADLSTHFDPKEHVKIKTRGVALVIENGIFHSQRVSHPVVMHDGGVDPTKGYSVRVWRERHLGE
jgi:hypothetical protein